MVGHPLSVDEKEGVKRLGVCVCVFLCGDGMEYGDGGCG